MFKLIELEGDQPPRFQAFARHVGCELTQVPTGSSWVERSESGIEGARGRKFSEPHLTRLSGRIHRLREEHHIGRNSGDWVIWASQSCKNRAEIGPKRVAADDRLDIVVSIAGCERANDRELVVQACESRKRTTEVDARNLGFDRSCCATYALWHIHLGIECLDLAWATMQKQEDHRSALQERIFRCSKRLS